MERVERVWHRRLRWRLRGAWQWPAFVVLTLVDGIVLVVLPPYDGAPENVFPGVVLAGFANLVAVAVLAPAVGLLLRRRRPDLPRLIAANYAGSWLLVALTALLLAAGLLNRSAVADERAREQAVAAAMHDYVIREEPRLRASLGTIDLIRIDRDYYRACIPGADPRHWLCLFVTTDQHPPGVTRDTEEVPNSSYRPYGGFD
jgi:4-amino-4-deoxy-L-arabinose transferase-like glycosyltransferase